MTEPHPLLAQGPSLSPPAPPGSRRRHRRVSCGVPAQVQGAQATYYGICRDISLGGLSVSGLAIPTGEKVSVVLELPRGGTLRLQGEVCRAYFHGEGAAVGVRFTHLLQEHLTVLHEFIASDSA